MDDDKTAGKYYWQCDLEEIESRPENEPIPAG